MNIEELIKEIGSGNLSIQWLHHSMKGSSTNKKDITTINFLTDVTTQELLNPKGKTAMIIWVDKSKLEKAWKKLGKKKNE